MKREKEKLVRDSKIMNEKSEWDLGKNGGNDIKYSRNIKKKTYIQAKTRDEVSVRDKSSAQKTQHSSYEYEARRRRINMLWNYNGGWDVRGYAIYKQITWRLHTWVNIFSLFRLGSFASFLAP